MLCLSWRQWSRDVCFVVLFLGFQAIFTGIICATSIFAVGYDDMLGLEVKVDLMAVSWWPLGRGNYFAWRASRNVCACKWNNCLVICINTEKHGVVGLWSLETGTDTRILERERARAHTQHTHTNHSKKIWHALLIFAANRKQETSHSHCEYAVRLSAQLWTALQMSHKQP